ncbi:MAG TPA: hypothetical protein VH328_16600 [Burkholderiaceae bacterium]|nr:hypothetical protein [Burkholderiaceae bacterium]
MSAFKSTACRLAALAALGMGCLQASAQTITALAHQPPAGVFMPFLLTDGRVLIQANNDVDFYLLTPDKKGSYVNGTWSKAASFPSSWNYGPDAEASQVLGDGRVIFQGGEYNFGNFLLTTIGGVYDPVKDKWTKLAPPPGWQQIGDSPSAILADGRYIVGRKLDEQMAALDPLTMQWTLLGTDGKTDFNSEEGWTLMPDGSILTADVLNAPNSERYLPDQQKWISDGTTVVDLHSDTTIHGCLQYPGGCYYPPGEIGPQILRPDGTVVVFGSSNGEHPGHTSLYTPGMTETDPGTWAPGPDFSLGNDSANDVPAVLLPSGNVLVEGVSARLYEYDGKTMTPTLSSNGGMLIMLPSGETLVTANQVEVYASKGKPQKAWAPKITKAPSSMTRGQTYKVMGMQFNGMSQAAGFGDEFETSTNYPLARITNTATGDVVYARTHDHSTMGVQTGKKKVFTNIDIPSTAEKGASTLVVVANGIPSKPVSVTIE